ncbi:MAG: hypothetical protein HYW88_02245, partial [Candidatus Sungbacteria bacterium]|nr:hypothetical protein [Candidatus Sungbacteria bacterium]
HEKFFSFKKIYALSLLIFIAGVFVTTPNFVRAEGAAVFIEPAHRSFLVGSTFDAVVVLDTGGATATRASVDLLFPTRELQLVAVSFDSSVIETVTVRPQAANATGKIFFGGILPAGGIKTKEGVLATLTFRVLKDGSGKISFLNRTGAFAVGQGRNDIVQFRKGAVYNFIKTPPFSPKISSMTYPDNSRWYNEPLAVFAWTKDRGVTGFGYSVDRDPEGSPELISASDFPEASFADLETGLWYFHLRAESDGVWSSTAHYAFKVDATPPEKFDVGVLSASHAVTQSPAFQFSTTDGASGFGHFELKTVSLDTDNFEETPFTTVTSPHQLDSLPAGKYRVIVRAFDAAGNWREEAADIRIVTMFSKIFSPDGVDFIVLAIAWPVFLVFLLLLILAVAVVTAYIWWRHHPHLALHAADDFNGITSVFKKVLPVPAEPAPEERSTVSEFPQKIQKQETTPVVAEKSEKQEPPPVVKKQEKPELKTPVASVKTEELPVPPAVSTPRAELLKPAASLSPMTERHFLGIPAGPAEQMGREGKPQKVPLQFSAPDLTKADMPEYDIPRIPFSSNIGKGSEALKNTRPVSQGASFSAATEGLTQQARAVPTAEDEKIFYDKALSHLPREFQHAPPKPEKTKEEPGEGLMIRPEELRLHSLYAWLLRKKDDGGNAGAGVLIAVLFSASILFGVSIAPAMLHADTAAPPSLFISPKTLHPWDEPLYLEGKGIPGAGIVVTLNKNGDAPMQFQTTVNPAGEWTFSKNFPALKSGEWELRVRAKLPSGEESLWSEPRIVNSIASGVSFLSIRVRYGALGIFLSIMLWVTLLLFFYSLSKAVKIRRMMRGLERGGKKLRLQKELLARELHALHVSLLDGLTHLRKDVGQELEHMTLGGGSRAG